MRFTNIIRAIGLIVGLWAYPAEATPPAIDASSASLGAFSGASSGSFTVSTTASSTIVVLFIAAERTNAQGSSATVSSVAGGSLTWHLRKQKQDAWGGSQCIAGAGNPCFGDTEEWWASASSPLSSASITVTFAQTIDNATMVAFGVTGAGSTSTPFDNNASLPATQSSTSGVSQNATVAVSTTQKSDLIYMGIGYSGNAGVTNGTTCSGLTQFSKTTTAGVGDTTTNTGAKQFSTAQTSLSQLLCAAAPSTIGFTAIGDAITNGSLTPPGRTILMGIP